jgi:hypothetical protein
MREPGRDGDRAPSGLGIQGAQRSRGVDVASRWQLHGRDPFWVCRQRIAQAAITGNHVNDPELAALDEQRRRWVPVQPASDDWSLPAAGKEGVNAAYRNRRLIAEQDDRGFDLRWERREAELQREAHPSLRIGIPYPHDTLGRVGWEGQPGRDDCEDGVKPSRHRELEHVLEHRPVPYPRQLLWRSKTT